MGLTYALQTQVRAITFVDDHSVNLTSGLGRLDLFLCFFAWSSCWHTCPVIYVSLLPWARYLIGKLDRHTWIVRPGLSS